MKHIILPAIIVIASMSLASCNDLNPQYEETEYDYTFDVSKAVSGNYFESPAEETAIALKANLPFESTIVNNIDNCRCDSSLRPEFVITADEIERVKVHGEMLSLTRDILVHVQPLEICRIKGYNYFNYPVLIRQRGEDGTQYLSKEEIKAYKVNQTSCADWFGGTNQHYVKGIVREMTSVVPYEGIPTNNGLFIFPLAAHQNSMYSDKPWNLETVEMTIDVNGETIKLKAIYEAPYGLVSDMATRIKTGDRIEANVNARGIHDRYEGIFVHPLAVRKL